ncbi:hypothetical protein KC366_g53 [Hortaea werneckii]|nr:hypothetical protein KC366_g53 [Hortaea werneckii]
MLFLRYLQLHLRRSAEFGVALHHCVHIHGGDTFGFARCIRIRLPRRCLARWQRWWHLTHGVCALQSHRGFCIFSRIMSCLRG